MKGKELCDFLKGIRKNIALYNGIDYTPHECNNTEDCSGTCPLCEHEAQILLTELKKREEEGHCIITDRRAIREIRKMNKQYEEYDDGMWLAGCPLEITRKKNE